jgi:hypothetical protein
MPKLLYPVKDDTMASKCPYPHTLRQGLEVPPKFMTELPNDKRGYPVPFFVDYFDGEPEFRAFDQQKMVDCIKKRLCWVCGNKLFREMVFVIGPMCAINRVNSEPPSHRECAMYSVRNCPFLSRPHMVRREDGLPEEVIGNAAGIQIARNPGAMCLWFTRKYTIMKVPAREGVRPGILFQLGTPFRVQWYAEGRPATREEVVRSIETGLPLLLEANEKESTEKERAEGRRMIDAQVVSLMKMVPKT